MSQTAVDTRDSACDSACEESREETRTLRELWEAKHLAWWRHLRQSHSLLPHHDAYAEVTAAIIARSQALRARLPFATRIIGAYNPCDRGADAGGSHITVASLRGFQTPRMKRGHGDALCKPSEKFWGLQAARDGDEEPTCVRCMEILERLAEMDASKIEPLLSEEEEARILAQRAEADRVAAIRKKAEDERLAVERTKPIDREALSPIMRFFYDAAKIGEETTTTDTPGMQPEKE